MSSTVRPRKKYDSVEMKPLATATDDDDDDGEHMSKGDKWLNYALHKLHALLWIVVAGGVTILTQLFEVVVDGHPPDRPEAQLGRCVPLHRAMASPSSLCLCVR